MSALLLSIGNGYASRALAPALPPGWTLVTTSRQPGADILWPDQAAEALSMATHLVSWVPPGGQGDPVLPVLADLPAPRLRWIGYASATSVYGDTKGAWIDDHAPCIPTAPRGQARLRAEAAWQDWADARTLPLARLRIAGIYGPLRSALDRLRAGTAQRIVKPGHVFNRIHVEDLARATLAAAAAGLAGPLILADGAPAPNGDVLAQAAALAGVTAPPEIAFEDARLTDAARSFYAENKRLHPRRLIDELKFTFHHPDYRTGLAAIHSAQLDSPPGTP